MDSHLSNVAQGAIVFTGFYFLVKSCTRLTCEFDCYHPNRVAVSSKVCTWAMGAIGAGLTLTGFAAIAGKN